MKFQLARKSRKLNAVNKILGSQLFFYLDRVEKYSLQDKVKMMKELLCFYQ